MFFVDVLNDPKLIYFDQSNYKKILESQLEIDYPDAFFSYNKKIRDKKEKELISGNHTNTLFISNINIDSDLKEQYLYKFFSAKDLNGPKFPGFLKIKPLQHKGVFFVNFIDKKFASKAYMKLINEETNFSFAFSKENTRNTNSFPDCFSKKKNHDI